MLERVSWAQQEPGGFARRPEGATDLGEAADAAPGAAEGNAALGSSGREAGGAPGPSGESAVPAGDPSDFLAREGEDAGAYAARIFQRVFHTDIESVLKMDVRPFCCPCVLA